MAAAFFAGAAFFAAFFLTAMVLEYGFVGLFPAAKDIAHPRGRSSIPAAARASPGVRLTSERICCTNSAARPLNTRTTRSRITLPTITPLVFVAKYRFCFPLAVFRTNPLLSRCCNTDNTVVYARRFPSGIPASTSCTVASPAVQSTDSTCSSR